MKTKLFNLIIAVVALSMAVGCTRIGPGYAGIKVSNTGSSKGVLNQTAGTGWFFYMPGASYVVEYPTHTQTIKWTKSPDEGSANNEEIVFTNKDKMTISVDTSLSYQIEQEKIPQFYVKFLTEDLQSFSDGYLHNVARDCFNEHGGKYTIDQIMGDNAQFIKDVKVCIKDSVASLGVNVTQFGLITAPRPPQTVLNQINASAEAQQLTVQKQNELAQVQADALKQVAAAEGQAKAQIAKADGQAEANRRVSASINQSILDKQKLDNQHDAIWRWNGKMPETVVGDSGVGGLILKK